MPSSPAGWYPNPYASARERRWDGTAWAAADRPRRSALERFVRALPWLRWLPWLVAVGVSTLVCFNGAESRGSSDPSLWVLIASVLIAALSLAGAAVTLRDRRWMEVLVLAALIAAVVAVAIVAAASPATSRSCNSRTDCDTSFGLGLPMVMSALFIPVAALGLVGRGVGNVTSRLVASCARAGSGTEGSG